MSLDILDIQGFLKDIAQDPPQSFIGLLSSDVLFQIFTLLFQLDRKVLLEGTTLVCRSWHYVSQKIIDSNIDLVISPYSYQRNIDLLARLESDPWLQGRCNQISIKEWFGSGVLPFLDTGRHVDESERPIHLHGRSTEVKIDNTWTQIQRLAAVIPQLNIWRFTWLAKPHVPDVVAIALAAKPKCSVSIHHRTDRMAYSHLFESMQSLESLTTLNPLANQLSKLGVIIPVKDRLLLNSLGKLILQSPGLKSLKIHGTKRIFLKGDIPMNYPSITDCHWLTTQLAPGTAIPALKELELTYFCSCQGDGGNWKDWDNLGWWSSITHLWVTCPSFIARSGRKLKQLCTLSLHLDSNASNDIKCCGRLTSDQDLKNSLLGLPESILTELTLINRTSALDQELIAYLGRSLKKLRVYELKLPPLEKEFLSIEQMGWLYVHTSLQELHIDIRDRGQLLSNYWDATAQFLPDVSSLSLNFAHAIQCDIFPPRLDKVDEVCKDVWDYFMKYQLGKNRLQKLILNSWSMNPNWRLTERTMKETGQKYCCTMDLDGAGLSVAHKSLEKAKKELKEFPELFEQPDKLPIFEKCRPLEYIVALSRLGDARRICVFRRPSPSESPEAFSL